MGKLSLICMHQYFIKIPRIVKKIFPGYVWNMPSSEKNVYLTFDDGPHPEITPWVLSQLKRWDAKATFFCLGKNVDLYPTIYRQIMEAGHSVGNHTYNHLNGWKVSIEEYMADINKASSLIASSLFRPPYGRIRNKHLIHLSSAMCTEAQVIMWDVLSADFDKNISKEKCFLNVLRNAKGGSIVVFHDSEKAWSNLKYALPLVLQQLTLKGYSFKQLENKKLNDHK